MKQKLFALLVLIAGLCVAGIAQAGPGSVEVQTLGDITIRMGAQIRIVPTAEVDRDFGVSNRLDNAKEAKAAEAMRSLGVGTDSTRVHLNEAGGAVKDSYIRGENRLFFNFIHGQDWDVYMALESDTVLDRRSADRTDFAYGRQSQQFGIERLLASFNVPMIHSRVKAGWDARGIDIGYGGLVYGDDDPGIGVDGGMDNFKWSVWYIKKDEDEAGYYYDPNNPSINPIGSPVQGKDNDRTYIYGKLGYSIAGSYIEGFVMSDLNDLKGMNIDRYFMGVNYKGTYGIFKPMAEIAYVTGDYDAPGVKDKDISSWAAFADLAIDLHEMVGIKEFEVHVGGIYAQGDDDMNDNDLEGWAPAVGITRFTPRFGSEQSISFDGNPILGQTLYSIMPAYYGTIRGAGINGAAALDNPGLQMIGGGIKAAYGRWTYVTHVMAMWFDESDAVETYYTKVGNLANVDIDEFMGVEWNNELRYQVYKSVTLKGGAAFLFPGDGAKDITKALDAIGRGLTNFKDGRESDDISMRFAAELLWFF